MEPISLPGPTIPQGDKCDSQDSKDWDSESSEDEQVPPMSTPKTGPNTPNTEETIPKTEETTPKTENEQSKCWTAETPEMVVVPIEPPDGDGKNNTQ